MKKLIPAVAAAALLGALSVPAFAEEASGVIESVDVAAQTVTLADGSTYILPPSVDAASLAPGQEILIEFEQGSDGSLNAMSVEPAS